MAASRFSGRCFSVVEPSCPTTPHPTYLPRSSRFSACERSRGCPLSPMLAKSCSQGKEIPRAEFLEADLLA